MPVWGGCEDYLVKSIQVVQNKAARLVCKKGIYTPIKTLLAECNWLSVNQMIAYHSLVLLYKVQVNHEPKYLHGMFTTERRYNTRGEGVGKLDCVSVDPPTLRISCHSFRWRTVQSWNHCKNSFVNLIMEANKNKQTNKQVTPARLLQLLSYTFHHHLTTM